MMNELSGVILPPSADDQHVEQAIWENMCAYYLSFGTIPGGACCDQPDLRWAHVGKPLFLNRVFGARFSSEEAVERVAQVTAMVKSWGWRVSWLIDPLSTPTDLVQILLKHGWTNPRGEGEPLLTWPGMALELSMLPEEISIPAGMTIARVTDDDALRAWANGFFSQAPASDFEEILAVYHDLGYGQHLLWAHYTAYLHGEPVVSSLLYFGAGVAGVYWVGTIPSARHQGIGTAITWYALQQAKQQGYHWATLQATAMGAPIYRRLGFKEYGSVICLAYQPQ